MNLIKVSFVLIMLLSEIVFAKAVSYSPDQLSKQSLKRIQTTFSKKNINLQSSQGLTLLMSAAIDGRMDLVEWLIKKKADLELKHKDGETALGFAIANDQIEIAHKLIDAGSKVQGLHAGEEKDTYFMKALFLDLKIAEKIFLKDPKVIDQKNFLGETALMKVARDGNTDQAKFLITRKANKNLKNLKNETALEIAIKNQQLEIAEQIK